MPVLLIPRGVPPAPLVLFQAQPLRQRLTRLARRVANRLLTAWRAWFADVRRSLDVDRLTTALTAPHLLEAEQVVMATWQTTVERPARAVLPLLMADVLQQVAAVIEPEMQEVAGLPVQVMPLPETQQEIDRSAGAQVTAVTTTTLLALRQSLRGGRAAGFAPSSQAAHVQTRLGLTPTQVHQLDQAIVRWQEEGRSAAQVQDGVEQATALGLSQRLRLIAQTQAYGAVNLGQRLAMTQAALTGPQGTAGVRRYWYLGPRPCEICVQIPGMNVGGVPLDMPFASPNGPLFDPPVHPQCQCGADYRQRG